MKIDMSLLRTYDYISTRKITQLGNELPPNIWAKLRAAIKEVNVKVLGNGGGITLNEPPDPNTLLALREVVDKLKTQKKRIGTLDDDRPFIYGTIDMYRQVFNNPMTNTPVYFTVGATSRTIVALGASVHGLGATGSEQPRQPGPDYPYFPEQDVMTAMMEAEDDEKRRSAVEAFSSPYPYAAWMYDNWGYNRAGKIKYEVLAQRDSRERVGPPNRDDEIYVIIGSPLFLAHA